VTKRKDEIAWSSGPTGPSASCWSAPLAEQRVLVAKYAILIIFVVSAVATPTSDVVNQTLMAAPMIVLYAVSIVIAAIFGKKRRRRGDDDEAD